MEIQKADGGGGGGGGEPAASPQYLSSTAEGTVSTFFGSSDLEAALPLSGFVQETPLRASDDVTVPALAQTLAADTTLTTITLTSSSTKRGRSGPGS